MKATALCLSALLACAVPVLARSSGKARISKFTGVVESVDASSGKVVLKDAKGASKEFALGPEVKVTKGGKAISLADVLAGDRLTVAYEGPLDSPRVKSVHVARTRKG